MGMNITQMPCNTGNYTAKRSSAIRYLVVHYTGAPGTARNNGAYFASRGDIGASAHYFVDAQDIVQSVPDGGRAWHCGAAVYKHPECRNDNSIGVELCCYTNGDGTWYFDPATVDNAVQLVRSLMAKYNIDADHVVRHYDVTGKRCPMPWVDDPAQWAAFLAMLTPEHQNDEEDENMVKYKTIDDVPEWYRSEVQELMDAGALKGTGNGAIDISEDVVRGAIIGMRYAEARNPRYYSLDDVPTWAREETQRLIDRGALQGDGKHELNVTYDALQAMIVCQRMIDAAGGGK